MRKRYDVRRAPAHSVPLAGRRITGSHPSTDLGIRQPPFAQGFADAGQRDLQVASNVVRQGLQRRDVDELRFILETTFDPLPGKRIYGCEKGGKRLAAPGRGGDQDILAGVDRWPSLRLSRGWRSKASVEPRGNRGMKQEIRRHGPITAEMCLRGNGSRLTNMGTLASRC